MTTYNTGNPIGSKDPRDLYDNAENFDAAINDVENPSFVDRFGRQRTTLKGYDDQFQQFLINSGYENIGDYAAGLEITARNQIFWRDGELYRAGAALELPYTTTGDWGAEEALFVGVGDAALRQELDAENGALMVRGAVIYVHTIADLQELDAEVGQAIYLTQDGRSGGFVVKSGTPPSDPQKGIYIVLDNGNYAERQADYLNPMWFGAVGDGVSDDTQALVAVGAFTAESSGMTVVKSSPDKVYKITGSLGDWGSCLITEDSFNIVVDNDISYCIKFTEYAEVLGLNLDFQNNCALSGYGIRFEKTFLFCGNISNLAGGGVSKGTATQYAIEAAIVNGTSYIRGSRFENITNVGDTAPTLYGFCGGIFFVGDTPLEGQLAELVVEDSHLSNFRTIFEDGATYSEKITDSDADAIRVFVSGGDYSTSNRVLLRSRNNTFRECQKRFYKSTYADVVIFGDYGYDPIVEDETPGMAAVSQVHGRLEMYDSVYFTSCRRIIFSGSPGAGGECIIDNVRVEVSLNSIDEADSRTSVFVDGIVGGHSTWRFNGFTCKGAKMFYEGFTGDTTHPHIIADNLYLSGFYSLMHYNHSNGSPGYKISNAVCIFNPVDLDNNGRSIFDYGDSSGANQKGGSFHNVYLEDPVDRTWQDGASPFVVLCESQKLTIDGLEYKSTGNSTRNNMVFRNTSNVFLRNINTKQNIELTNLDSSTIIFCNANSIEETDVTNLKSSNNVELSLL